MTQPPATATAVEPAELTAGSQLVYQLDYSSQSSSDFRGTRSGPAQIESRGAADGQTESKLLDQAHSFLVEVRGHWQVTLLAAHPAGASLDVANVAFQLRSAAVKLTVDGHELREQSAQIAAGLERPAFANMDHLGRIQTVRFAADTDVIASHFARALMAVTQFTRPNNSSMMSPWEVHEQEPNGTYIARYEPLSLSPVSHRGRSFRKTKLRFLIRPPEPGNGVLTAPQVISPGGELTAELDAQRAWVQQIEGTESQAIRTADRTIGRAKNTILMSLLEVKQITGAELRNMHAASRATDQLTPACSLSEDPFEQQMTARLHASVLKDSTVESLLADLDQLDAATEYDAHAEASLLSRLRALIYLRPACIDRLAARLATADVNSVTLRIVPLALASAGGAEAQRAILAVLDSRRDESAVQLRLLVALGDLEHPGIDAERHLRQTAWQGGDPDVAPTALFALGSTARSLARTSPERAVAIVDEMLQRLAASQPAREQRMLIQALGIAGLSRSFPTLNRYVSHNDPMLRGAAVYALRGIEGAEVQQRLLEVLNGDSHASVRLEATRALGLRYPDRATITAELAALKSDLSREVRNALLHNLWRARHFASEVRAAIERTSLRDDSADVRRTATRLLASEDASR